MASAVAIARRELQSQQLERNPFVYHSGSNFQEVTSRVNEFIRANGEITIHREIQDEGLVSYDMLFRLQFDHFRLLSEKSMQFIQGEITRRDAGLRPQEYARGLRALNERDAIEGNTKVMIPLVSQRMEEHSRLNKQSEGNAATLLRLEEELRKLQTTGSQNEERKTELRAEIERLKARTDAEQEANLGRDIGIAEGKRNGHQAEINGVQRTYCWACGVIALIACCFKG